MEAKRSLLFFNENRSKIYKNTKETIRVKESGFMNKTSKLKTLYRVFVIEKNMKCVIKAVFRKFFATNSVYGVFIIGSLKDHINPVRYNIAKKGESHSNFHNWFLSLSNHHKKST